MKHTTEYWYRKNHVSSKELQKENDMFIKGYEQAMHIMEAENKELRTRLDVSKSYNKYL